MVKKHILKLKIRDLEVEIDNLKLANLVLRKALGLEYEEPSESVNERLRRFFDMDVLIV